ncbi:MAG: hypothetical protein RLY93_16850 [Sumerlaeia bacterium]
MMLSKDLKVIFHSALAGGLCAGGAWAQELQVDTTWALADSPISVTQWVTVASGATLTIEPGVVVEMDRSRGITISADGSMVARGSVGAPITFVSSAEGSHWSRIEAALGSTFEMDHCLLLRGGETDGALVIKTSDATVRNCSIQNSLRNGVYLDGAGIAPEFEALTITGSVDSAIYQGTADMAPEYAFLSASGNGFDGMTVRNTAVAGAARLHDGGLPYLYEFGGDLQVLNGGSLTLDPGVTVLMGSSGFSSRLTWNVQAGGALIAMGSAEKPIRITSAQADPTPGYWNRIDLNPGATGRFQHCTIEYGGAGTRLMAVNSSDVDVRDCVFQHGSGDGIALQTEGIAPRFERVSIQHCTGRPIWQSTVNMSPFYRDLSFSNTGRDVIHVTNGTITGATTLTECGIPYYFSSGGNLSVVDGARFEIEAGVVVLMGGSGFTSGLSWDVQAGGEFVALGTEAMPVRIVSASENPARGDWNSLNIAAGARANLSYCAIRHGRGMVNVFSSAFRADHCEFGFSSGYGLSVLGEGISPVLADVTFTSNSLNGLLLEDRHQAPEIRNAAFVENGDYAIRMSSIDMTPVFENLSMERNATDGVHIVARPEKPLTRRTVWPADYGIVRLDSYPTISAGASLTIDPGVEVRLGSTGSTSHLVMTVQDGGALVANGTEQNPILFTSYNASSPNRGDWDSILVSPGGAASFDHCVFEYGAQYNPAIRIQSSDVTLRNSRFRFLGRDAVNLDGLGITPALEAVDVSETGGVAFRMQTLAMQPTLRNLSAAGTGRNVVWVDGATLTMNVRLSRCGLPYELRGGSNVATSATLTIDPGVTLLCNGSSIGVQAGGRIEARGTAAQPIRFVPFDNPPSLGEWWYVDVQPGASAHLDSCEFAWGGGQVTFHDAMLLIGSSQTFVRNCQFHDGLGGIRIHSGAQPTLVNNQLYNGQTSMVNSSPGTIVDARFTWWGHPSGPKHYSNPDGQGMAISNGIQFLPWAISPDGAASRAGTEIALGESLEGTAPSLGLADYTLNLSQGEADNVLIRMEPIEGSGSWQLWGRRGLAPTESSHDWEGAARDGGLEFVISQPAAGAYIFTVLYEDLENEPAPDGRFQISCREVSRHVSHVAVASGGNAGVTTQRVIGAGFENGMRVELRRGTSVLRSFSPSEEHPSELTMACDLSGLSPGTVDVATVWPDEEERLLTGAFIILPGTGPRLRLWLDVNPFIRPNRTATMMLIYENIGDSDLPAPWVTIRNTDDVEWRLNAEDEFVRGDIHVLATSQEAPASVLSPGEINRIPIGYRVEGEKNYSFQWSWYAADTGTLDLEVYKETMRPAYLMTGDWEALWPSLKARLGTSWQMLRSVLHEDAERLLARGETSYAIDELLELEIRAEAGLPLAAVSGVVLDGQTGAAKSGVAVTALSEDESVFSVGFSDASGHYVIPQLADGSYLISVDGFALEPYPIVPIAGQSDISDLELIVWPLPEALEIAETPVQDHNPALASATDGEVLLAWEHGGALRSARWSGGAWVDSAALAGIDGEQVAVAWHEELFGSGQPGYVAVWQSIGSAAEAATIRWSAGQIEEGQLRWSAPVPLTNDANEDAMPEVVVADSGTVIVFWLQRNSTGNSEDDTDLYFATIDISQAKDWARRGPLLDTSEVFITPDTECAGWELKFDLPVPEPADKTIGKKFALVAAGQVCRDTPTCKGFSDLVTSELKVTLGDKLDIGGNATGTISYYLRQPQCYYLKKSTTIALNGILQGTVDTPIPVLIGGVPVGTLKPAATAGGSLGGKLGWFASQPGAWPHYGAAELSLNSGGKANFTDYLGATDLGGGFDITGTVSYTFGGPTPGASADQLCLTVYGTISVFRGVMNRKFIKKMGGRCSSKDAFFLGEETKITDKSIVQSWRRFEKGYPVIETLETTIDPFTGTGGHYEGTPVVANVSADLYHDGPATAVRMPGGGVQVIWKKETGDYDTALGSLITIATSDGNSASGLAHIDSQVSFSNDPSLAYDAGGNLIAVWARAESAGLTAKSSVTDILKAQNRTEIVFAAESMGAWSTPARLTPMPSGQNDRPRIAIDAAGNRAVVWLNSRDGQITVQASGGNGTTWSAPLEISRSPLFGPPVLSSTGTGFLAVWTEDLDGSLETLGDTALKYTTSSNGTVWALPRPLPESMYPVRTAPQTLRRPAKEIAKSGKRLPAPPAECCQTPGCPPKCPPPPPPTPPPPAKRWTFRTQRWPRHRAT